MKTPTRPLLILLLAAAGCSQTERYKTAKSPVDKALVFTEQDRHDDNVPGKGRSLSAVGADGAATRVPNPALVDIDSTILISVDKTRLAEREGKKPLGPETNDLKAKEDTIRKLLEILKSAIQKRTEAAAAFAATLDVPPEKLVASVEFAAFQKGKSAFAAEEGALLRGLMNTFAPMSPQLVAIRANLLKGQGDLSAMRPVLQDELLSIGERQKALTALVDSRSLSLRLEAFLESTRAKLERSPIHLENYDNLDQGDLKRTDRMGLNLSADEQQDLRDLMHASTEFARTANEVRKGEIGLREAFTKVSATVDGKLTAFIGKVETAWTSVQAFKTQTADVRTGLKKLLEDLAKKAGGARKEAEAELRAALAAADASLLNVVGITEQLLSLRERWRHPSADDLPTLIPDTARLAGEMNNVLSALGDGDRAKVILDGYLQAIEKVGATLADKDKKELLDLWNGSDAKTALDKFVGGLKTVLDLLPALKDLLGGVKDVAPLPNDLKVPEAFNVPLDRIKDTFIELERTPRRIGDRVLLRASLLEGQESIDQSVASFDVEEFGWHASLAPSVILARPRELQGRSESFNFAPSLGWVHRYTPRPDQSSWWAPIRFLDPAIGLHVAFLDFNPDKSVEVGLGAMIAFWGDRIQVGGGYNLMAPKHDGGYYFFVGSSLLPILQDLGLSVNK